MNAVLYILLSATDRKHARHFILACTYHFQFAESLLMLGIWGLILAIPYLVFLKHDIWPALSLICIYGATVGAWLFFLATGSRIAVHSGMMSRHDAVSGYSFKD